MSVWLCIPSARPPEEAERVLKLWRQRGYRVYLWRDPQPTEAEREWVMDTRMRARWELYPGYAVAVNTLAREVLHDDPQAEWLVTGGDDVEPDLNHTAVEIARECVEYFEEPTGKAFQWVKGTFGVMQPTGDRFAGGSIDRICGSPWLGREFCRRMYQGNGPLFEGYRHMFVDEELFEVSKKLGVLWQRPDLIHLHRHFQREDDTAQSDAVRKPVPAHLVKWNTQEHWAESQTLFRARKAAGFPGHEPIS